jgi:hypothetical protein
MAFRVPWEMTICESVVVVGGLRAALTDILTDLWYVEGLARAHIVSSWKYFTS